MNKTIGSLMLLAVIVSGCRRTLPEIGLTREHVLRIKKSEVSEIKILTAAFTPGGMPYHYWFSVTDPEKIGTIIDCIRDSQQTEKDEISDADLKKNSRLLVFQTRRASYSTRIAWNDDFVYGTWDTSSIEDWLWKSSALRDYFRKWNLIEAVAAADPKWPDPQWMKTSTPDSNSFFPPLDFQKIEQDTPL